MRISNSFPVEEYEGLAPIEKIKKRSPKVIRRIDAKRAKKTKRRKGTKYDTVSETLR